MRTLQNRAHFIVIIAVGASFMVTWLHNLHNQALINAHPTKQCEFVVIIAVGSLFMATASQPQNAAPHPARPAPPSAPKPPR